MKLKKAEKFTYLINNLTYIRNFKMLQSPSKYHSNPLSQLLALHHHSNSIKTPSSPSTTSPTSVSVEATNALSLDTHCSDSTELNCRNASSIAAAAAVAAHAATHLDSINDNIGKSFTIAAILGLKKNSVAAAAVAAMDHHHQLQNHSEHHLHHQFHNNSNTHHYHGAPDFSIMNLSLNHQQLYKNVSATINNNNHSNLNNNNSNNINNNSAYESECRLIANVAATNRLQQQLGQHLVNNGATVPGGTLLHHSHIHHHQQHHSNASALHTFQHQLHHHNNQNVIRERRKNDQSTSSKKSSIKSKRVRTIFTPEQLERLEAEFERQQYMVGPERLYLAHTLQLTEAQVKVWFQNRRIKWRKHHLEITQQRLAIIRQTQLVGHQTEALQQVQQKQTDQHQQQNPLNAIPSVSDESYALSICTDSMDTSSSREDDM